MKRSALTAILLAVISTIQAAAEEAYQWHRVEWDRNRIEFGVPGTVNRLLVIACNANGKIDFWGPIPGDDWDFTEGGKIEVTLRIGGLRQRISGVMGEAGNGPNFILSLSPRNQFLAQLGSGKSVEISRTNGGYEVLGHGGERLIKDVVTACENIGKAKP